MNANMLTKLQSAMKTTGVDALFVSNPKNVKYLTGFKTTMPGEVQSFGDPEGFVLVHPARVDFLCDGRYINAARQMSGVTAQLLDSPVSAASIARKIKELLPGGVRTLGVEHDAMVYCDGLALAENLGGLTRKAAEGILAGLRLCKSPEEIALLRKAEAITGDCFNHVIKLIRPGMTEREVGLEVDNYLRSHSEGCSFETIVAFGETSCNPHYTPDPKRKLKKGQLVLLDLGSIHQGYCGDMTRVVCLGKADERQHVVYNIVLEAQLAGLAAVRPGAKAHDIDQAVRKVFEKYNCVDKFLHGTGHGIGLAIHEAPRIKSGFDTLIEPGMVFSIEPGLYYAGWGGVRIEDVVVVTETGYENLTRTPKKQLIELGVSAGKVRPAGNSRPAAKKKAPVKRPTARKRRKAR